MNFVASAFGFFLLVVLTHVLAYRRGLLQFQMGRFFIIALFWGMTYAAGLIGAAHGPTPQNGPFGIRDMPLIFTSLTVYGLLCLAYLAQCTGIQVQSPSMKVISLIRREAGQSISYEKLRTHFTDEEFVLARLNDLVQNGYVRWDGSAYLLTPRGEKIVRIFGAYQRMIRRTMED